jgi:hypothetical protein
MTIQLEQSRIPFPVVRSLVEMYYDFQGQRIISGNRIDGNVRQGLIIREDMEKYGVDDIFEQATLFEKEIQKRLTREIKSYPLYTDYFEKIYGIGPILSAGLMAYIEDISKFRHVSSLWQYCGLGMNTFCEKCKKPTSVEITYEGKKGKTVAKRQKPMKVCPVCDSETIPFRQRRVAGFQSNYNDKFKVLCWKIGSSFVKQSAAKSGYRRLYDEIKITERRKHPEKIVTNGKTTYNDGHIHNMTMRKVVKIFLSHIWTRWRTLDGLEVTKPYESQILNHSIVEPFVDKVE